MNPFLSFLIRSAAAIPAAVVIWLISFFGLEFPYLLSSAAALAGGALVYWLAGIFSDARFLKKHGLTRKEYRYIRKNLDEAKKKISRLNKTLFSIRHFPSIKQRIELFRVIRKIYSMTKKEPKRFYQAERFYFSHLDSILELTEKYAFISSQPKKNRELDEALYQTRETLSELSKAVEKDLYQVLSNDLEHLSFEIDVAKHSIKTANDIKNEARQSVPLPKNTAKPEVPVAPTHFVHTETNANKRAEEEEKTENQQQTGPRYSINTHTKEKVEIPIYTTREERYKAENRRSNR